MYTLSQFKTLREQLADLSYAEKDFSEQEACNLLKEEFPVMDFEYVGNGEFNMKLGNQFVKIVLSYEDNQFCDGGFCYSHADEFQEMLVYKIVELVSGKGNQLNIEFIPNVKDMEEAKISYTVNQIKEAGADVNIHPYYIDDLIKNLDLAANQFNQDKLHIPTDDERDSAAIEFCKKHYSELDDTTKECETFDAGIQWLIDKSKQEPKI